MANLSNPKNTIAVLQKYQFHFQKKLGQNFLVDPHVLEKIIYASHINSQDLVLEIGPGIGTLTQYLCEHAKQVIAIEIDHHLIPILEDTLSEYQNVKIIENDILKVNIQEIAEIYHHGQPIKIVANLPYYITTPIIMRLFESHAPVDSITVMVQKEVAARMQAVPNTKDYGALSLAIQYYAKPYIAAYVPPNCFIPRPNVGSAVICLTKHTTPPVQIKNKTFLFQIIHASFQQRRKTLTNSLSNASELSLNKSDIIQALETCSLSPSIRGEALTLEQFAQLADILYS